MSELFESMERAMLEAIEFAEGKDIGARVHHFEPLDVKEIRQNVEMTQEEFAQTFGFSVRTLRYWERGERTPTGTALVLLNVMAKEPQAVLRALSIAV